jgi:hypothetical protein
VLDEASSSNLEPAAEPGPAQPAEAWLSRDRRDGPGGRSRVVLLARAQPMGASSSSSVPTPELLHRELLSWDLGRARGRARLARGFVRAGLVLLSMSSATATVAPVNLGGALEFGLLTKITITNTPASLITVRAACQPYHRGPQHATEPTHTHPQLPHGPNHPQPPHNIQPNAFNPLPSTHSLYPTDFAALTLPNYLLLGQRWLDRRYYRLRPSDRGRLC